MPHLSRAQWAKRIRSAHTKTVAAILKLGRTLLAAKKALPHGEFLKMIKHDLPFTPSTAQRLMAIAADPKIANAARAQLLPRAWSTLYELTKVPEPAFERAVSAGDIHPKMTRDASRFLTLKVTQEPARLVSPYYSSTEPDDETEQGHPRPVKPVNPLNYSSEALDLLEKLERLETLVASLCADVEQRGAVAPVAERRIRALARVLLSLVEQREPARLQ
jgi:hypothetical protein